MVSEPPALHRPSPQAAKQLGHAGPTVAEATPLPLNSTCAAAQMPLKKNKKQHIILWFAAARHIKHILTHCSDPTNCLDMFNITHAAAVWLLLLLSAAGMMALGCLG